MNMNVQIGQVLPLSGADRLENLLTTDALQVSRVMLPAGEKHRSHDPRAETLVICVSGAVRVYVKRDQLALGAGELIRLPAGEPCAVDGEADALVLLIITQPTPGSRSAADEVETASEQSFPASDAPAWTQSPEELPAAAH